MKKVLSILSMAAVSAMAVKATQIGPVSTYGELKAAMINNKGQLVGSCPQYSENPVQVKGLSLYWSSGAEESTVFYSEKGINHLVDDMKIEVVRFAMGVSNPEFDNNRGYITGGETKQKAMLKAVVNAAIEKDIYVIIDWHIESGEGYTDKAVDFFKYAAETFGSYNNVIFEVWNEPKDGATMSQVADHANKVIAAIREAGSDNLVLVGSPEWSSHPEQCAAASIVDSKKNYACTLHFYAATHPADGNSYDKRAEEALEKVPVFATEWGSVESTGRGNPSSSASDKWVSWMSQNGVSWAYWNASAVKENQQTSATFENTAFDNGFTLSESGKYISAKLSKGNYSDCGLQNGNAEEESGFSEGVAKGTVTSMIDDMEDGDRYSYIGGGWNGFDDQTPDGSGNKGGSSVSNKKIKDDFGKEIYNVILPSDGGKNTSKYMVGINKITWNQGTLTYSPYVAIGLDLKKDTTVYADFAKCTTIKYKYKGASHNFRIETTDITDYNYHRVNKDYSDEWKEVEITIDMLKQETWGNDNAPQKAINLAHATRLAWEVKAPDNAPPNIQPTLDYLYIDDLSCDGLSITAVSGDASETSSSSTNESSSSKGNGSSSSVVTGSSSSDATVSSSSDATVSSSSQATELTVVKLIDDVEDENEVLETTGTWYAYTDKEPGGKSSITNEYDETLPGYVVVFPGTTDATNGTKGFVGLTGIVWNQAEYAEAPFVALGINMVKDTAKGLDMSECDGVSYRYKGSQHVFKVQDGLVTDYAYHQSKQTDTAEWTTVTLLWSNLKQPSWSKDKKDLNIANIKKMAWEVVGYKGFDVQPTTDYLYVDDLKCVADPNAAKTAVRMARAAASLKLNVQDNMLNVVTASAGRVQVFDMMGNVVANKVLNAAGNHQVSLEGVNRGNYVVRVKTANAVKTARISIR